MTSLVVGRRLLRLTTVVSTMEEVDALARAGEPEGTVVVADAQTGGRGRAGRTWSAPAGTSVLCSVLLRPVVSPARLGTLPLVAGVAVAEALEAVAGVACRLKWPNDVWLDGRKVAGILVAARHADRGLEYAVVGIGINVNIPPDDLVADAVSLAVATGWQHDREAILRAVLERLDAGYRSFVGAEGRPDLDGWRRRGALLGETVKVSIGARELVGVLRGVGDRGELLLEPEPGRIEPVPAGELTRGPVVA